MLWGIKGKELLADEVGKEEQEIETCLLQSIILCRHILRQARRQQRPAASDLMMCQSPKGQHGPDLYPRRWWDAGSLQTTLLPSDVTCAKWNFMFAEHEQPVPITVPGKSKQTQQNQQNLTVLPADGHASGTFRLQVSQNEERTGRGMAKLLFGLIRQKLLMYSVEWGVGERMMLLRGLSGRKAACSAFAAWKRHQAWKECVTGRDGWGKRQKSRDWSMAVCIEGGVWEAALAPGYLISCLTSVKKILSWISQHST